MKNILVVRNDKLGDFTLALPVFMALKTAFPDVRLTALVSEYTADFALKRDGIDNLLIDPENPVKLSRMIEAGNFDAVITLYSTPGVGLAVFLAGIPYRLAPATKWAQMFYNHRLKQRRSQSIKPEYEYNLDLVRYFLKEQSISNHINLLRPVISVSESMRQQHREQLGKDLAIDPNSRWIFVHPGHGGSANNLSHEQYAALINHLPLTQQHAVVITAGPNEEWAAKAVRKLLEHPASVVYTSTEGINRFVDVLSTADLFIAGSTGPLHLAGALDCRTAAFYPRRRTSSPLRWQTLNAEDRRVAFTPPPAADERDMQAVDLQAASRLIQERFDEIF